MSANPCQFCGTMTVSEFCSDLCYLDYQAAKAEIREQLENNDDGRCEHCLAFIRSNGDCDCEPEDEEGFEMGERMDYGYDSVRSELDEPCDWHYDVQEYDW